METTRFAILAAFAFFLLSGHAHAQVPQMINYQGRIAVDGTNYHGTGQFKFALVDGAGTASYWSNDGSSVGGGEPTIRAVSLSVSRGLFSVALGDPAGGMSGILPTVFTNNDVRIRTWFSDGGGFQQLSPDQRIVAVGYAMVANTVAGDPYVRKSGDTMTGQLHIQDGTGVSGSGGHLHIGDDVEGADEKLISFGDLEEGERGWVSIGERGQDDTLELRAQRVYVSPSGYGNCALGIGVSNPVEKLHVDGAVILGNAITNQPGTIRWTGSDFEGYDGSAWISLTQGAAVPAPAGTARVPGGMIDVGDPCGKGHVRPAGMAGVPGGTFEMGDSFRDGHVHELPAHYVYVSPFLIDRYEVTSNLWRTVYDWACTHGYGFDNAGSSSGTNHPVHTLNWYDCVKWCNARSEREGLAPAYYASSAMTTVYTRGRVDITESCVDWNANGYRLPTEAEWEKAARGGERHNHFSWPSFGGTYDDHIDGSKANYDDSGDPFEDGTTPVGYYDGGQSPAGPDMANALGLYDTMGNAWEWCWDWYQSNWYGRASARVADTRGPIGPLTTRVRRGGSRNDSAVSVRCATRDRKVPGHADSTLGFRCVRSVNGSGR